MDVSKNVYLIYLHRRKAHYNEFHAVRLAKELLAQEEDEDEEVWNYMLLK